MGAAAVSTVKPGERAPRPQQVVVRTIYGPDGPMRTEEPCGCQRCRGAQGDVPFYFLGWAGHSREVIRRLVPVILDAWLRRQRSRPDEATIARMEATIIAWLNEARWNLRYDCWEEENAPPPPAARKKPRDRQAEREDRELLTEVLTEQWGVDEVAAIEEGLTVRDPRRRSIWAPLMQGQCESCEGLRMRKRRFCQRCEAMSRRVLKEAGWSRYRVAKYLAAPENGVDEFAVDGEEL